MRSLGLLAITATTMALLSGCGGGGSSDPTPNAYYFTRDTGAEATCAGHGGVRMASISREWTELVCNDGSTWQR